MFTHVLNKNQGGSAGTMSSVDILIQLRETLHIDNKNKGIHFGVFRFVLRI